MQVQLTESTYDPRIFIATISVAQYPIDKYFRKTKLGFRYSTVDEEILDKFLLDLKLKRIRRWSHLYPPYTRFHMMCKLYRTIVISDRDYDS